VRRAPLRRLGVKSISTFVGGDLCDAVCAAVVASSLIMPLPAAASVREPACPPGNGAGCEFDWFGSDNVRHPVFTPNVDVCVNMVPGGAIAGTNHTTRRVQLYKQVECGGGAAALVAPGRSWRDPSHVYFSFKPVTYLSFEPVR
jgi:hypothetical protein